MTSPKTSTAYFTVKNVGGIVLKKLIYNIFHKNSKDFDVECGYLPGAKSHLKLHKEQVIEHHKERAEEPDRIDNELKNGPSISFTGSGSVFW